ncbi:hypothetical protein K435DRAFT_966719 [Dendrothele bispora CBS 962.96]|uniref:Glutamine amidotransferase type-2 domain-containing protein n=1 Tax=Dendrothele bispora (strain CBS 962.96) TaxID=1314807 RepID=A0A4S8LYT1_DENBC|nr:hypothetical protein K435DRAFT_966719 [Dendrothele bispora CBS 962.96]
MCGIFFCTSTSQNPVDDDLLQKLREINAHRGPDAQSSCFHSLDYSQSQNTSRCEDVKTNILQLEFFSSELRLRGNLPVIQPHQRNGNVLCWNGEITADENDGVELFEILSALNEPEEIRDTFAQIEGPYALVFYHAASQKLFFARDPLGRRSLLISKPSSRNPYFLLASVSSGNDPRYDFEEVATGSIHVVDFSRLKNYTDVAMAFDDCLSPLPRQSPAKPSSYAVPCRLNQSLPDKNSPRISSLDDIPDWLQPSVDDLISHLDKSVMLRVQDIPRNTAQPGQSRVAVLFSGGIDSTIITLLAHKHIPTEEPIDLLNVAFENPRKIRVQNEGNFGGVSKKQKKQKTSQKTVSTHETYLVPDRKTGLQEVEELRRLCPGRIWNFVEVNVPYQESRAARKYVEALMAPGRTVMDLSLALALYFAARGIGQIRPQKDADSEPYTSPARVLLNGLGSDELLGGYGRHRSAYNTGGWPAVIEELQLEIDRIPTRNLGRDDRVISSHGKETRHPFLSLDVVSFLAKLPVHIKTDPRLEVGLGDKMLLRLASRKLGLVEASSRKKRAMQFGSHSARMEETDTKGDLLLD